MGGENIKVYQDGGVTLYDGDCLDIMRDIPDQSIDMILCDIRLTQRGERGTIDRIEVMYRAKRRGGN